MPAKLLNAFAYDDHPDLHRQIGCMSGLFQVFDRRHLLSGRQKRLPSGNLGAESHEHMILEKNNGRSMSENQRISVESSRPSFSSSSGCSSFTSLECNKSTQHEEFTCLETNFQETSSRNFQHNIDCSPDRCFYVPGCASRQVGHRSLDFGDVVKDSIYRENYAVSNKSIGEVKKKVLRHGNSPRPIPLPKSKDESSHVEKNGKSRISMNIDKSLGLLVSSNQPRRLFTEVKEPHRSSYGTKEDSYFSISKESPRLSCDSYVKSATNINDLPRLSLDSKERTMKGSNFKALGINHADKRMSRDFTSNHGFNGEGNPSNVVAKLMGLETMPSPNCASLDHQLIRSTSSKYVLQDQMSDNFFSNSPKFDQGKKQNWSSFPQRSSMGKPTVQRQTIDSRVPIEPAPWTHQEMECFSQASKSGCKNTPARQRQESVYSEIDKKLGELELLQSNKDFRALKQILDSIKAKRMSETKKSKEQQQSFGREKPFDCQRPSSYEKSKSEDCQHISLIESPIVIIKPAKSTKKSSSLPQPVIPLKGLAGLHKVRTSDSTDNKKTSISNQTAKDRTPNSSPKLGVDHLHSSKNKNSTSCVEANLQGQYKQRLQGSSSPRPPSSENGGNSLKSSSSSPRTQQKKGELENKSRSSVFSSSAESSKPRRLSKQSLESVSSEGKLRCKPKHIRKTEISHKSRHLSRQSDEMPTNSDISLASHVDSDVGGTDQSSKLSSSPRKGNNDKENINSLASIKETKKSLVKRRENSPSSKFEVINSEHPSPISILDTSIYKDDSPSSPANEITCSIKDASGIDSPPLGVLEIDPSTKIKHNKLRNIDILVQKLGQLTLSEEESMAASHHTQDPNHRYMSDVLMASGLLFQDFRLLHHHSGHAINPDLFLVLEQRWTGLGKSKSICDRVPRAKPDPDQLHRKLMFDMVDEILTQKLDLGDAGPHCPATRMRSGQHVLQELCSEIDQLQGDSLKFGSTSDEDRDSLKTVLSQDVMRQTRQWNYMGEVAGMVLDIERSIFKDLLHEIIDVVPIANLQAESSRRRRRLSFAK